MQAGAIQPSQNVVIIDDLIATGELHPPAYDQASQFVLQGGLPAPQANSSLSKAERRPNTSLSSKLPS